jgi:hypothetical protein
VEILDDLPLFGLWVFIIGLVGLDRHCPALLHTLDRGRTHLGVDDKFWV